MKKSGVKTVILGEWRQYRLFLLLVLLLVLIIRISVSSLIVHGKDETYFRFFIGYLFFPFFFALFLGVISFGTKLPEEGEFPIDTVSSWKTFCLKFLLGLFLLLFLVTLAHIIFYIPSSFISNQLRMKPDIFIFFYLPFIFIFTASVFTSLWIKKGLLAVFCTPFVLSVGLVFMLPLLAGLVSAIRSVQPLLFATASLLILPFAFFSFLVWQRAILKRASPMKIVIMAYLTLLIVSLGIHALFNLVAGIRLNKAIQQAKASQLPVTLSEIIPPPVPGEDNAALIYQEAFALLKELEEKHKEEFTDMFNKGTVSLEELAKDRDETITQLLLNDQDFITVYNLIERAVRVPDCRFELRYEDGAATHLPHLSGMRRLERLVAARTELLAMEGRYYEALKSAQTGFSLGDALIDEPILMSQLVRIAVDRISMNSLQSVFNNCEQEIPVQDCRGFIAGIENKKGLSKGLEGTFSLFNSDLFNRILEDRVRIRKYKPKGFFHSLGVVIDLKTKGEELEVYIPPGVNFRVWPMWIGYVTYLGRPIVKRDCAFYLGYLKELVPLSRLPYYQVKSRLAELEERAASYFYGMVYEYPFIEFLLINVDPMLKQQAEYYALLDGLKITLALKMYEAETGEYPEKLGALSPGILPKLPKDPFTGNDYVYKQEGEEILIYSLADDIKDDGGISRSEKSFKGDFDIVWRLKK